MGLSSDAVLTSRSPGFIPRRPVVAAAISMIAGASLCFTVPERPLIFISATAGLAALATVFQRRPLFSSCCVAVALLLIGLILAQAEFFRYADNDIGLFASAQQRLASLELRIDRPPRIVNPPGLGSRPSQAKQMFTASVVRISTLNGWIDARGDLLVDIANPNQMLAQGQVIRVLGMLSRPAPATNPGQFDWAAYYRKQRIVSTLQVSRAENVKILSDHGSGILGWMRESARRLLAMGFPAGRTLDLALLRALVLGDGDPTVRDVIEAFQRIGTAYQLSVSGMHIAILAGFVYALCRLTLRPPRFSCSLSLFVVLIYGAAAAPAVPILRATLVCSMMLLGTLGSRTADKMNLLALAAIVVLYLHPLDVFSAGFQLGFVTILGLIVLGRPVLHWLAERDVEERARKVLPSGWVVVFRRVMKAVQISLVLSVICWLTSLPLVAYQFGEFNPWAIPAGLVMLPVVAIALLGGCGKILLTLACPSLAGLWARGATVPVVAMRHLAEGLAHMPGAGLPIAQPPIWMIMLYYAVLCMPLFRWRWNWLRQTARFAPAMAVGAMLLVICPPVSANHAVRDGVSITLLDIGAGQCAVAEFADADASLIDAGSTTISDVTRNCVGPFLREEGSTRINAALLSHSDYDHISAILTVATEFGIRQVYTSPYFRKFARVDPPAQSMLDGLDRTGQTPRIIRCGDQLALAKGVSVSVLWPPVGCNFTVNNTGLVLRLTYAGKTVLFPADIQADAMRELLKTPLQLKADVLVAPHHGSSEINTADFVRAVDPSIIISSNAATLTGKQKRFEHLIGNRPLYRTSDFGAITIQIRKDGTLTIDTFRRHLATTPSR